MGIDRILPLSAARKIFDFIDRDDWGDYEDDSARLWLTLDESAAYSGLPSAVIVDFIGKGKLPAMDVGRGRHGGRWRIRKVDLEGFAG